MLSSDFLNRHVRMVKQNSIKIALILMCDREIPGKTAFMPEWSKGADLRSAGVPRGFEPH